MDNMLNNDILKKWLPIVILALLVSIISTAHVIIGFIKSPQNAHYLATGHYYLDYFVYIQAISQGMWGEWHFENYLNGYENNQTILVYFPYLLLGKIASLLGISVITAYWGAVFLLTFSLVCLAYFVITKLLPFVKPWASFLAVLLYVLSTPFYFITKTVNSIDIKSFDFWYAPSTLFSRFEPVPHHILGNIIILFLIYVFAKIIETINNRSNRQLIAASLGLSVLTSGVLSFYPYHAITLVVALLITGLAMLYQSHLNQRKYNIKKVAIFFTLFFIVVTIAGLWIYLSSRSFPLFSRLNRLDLVYSGYYHSLAYFILSYGLVGIMGFISLLFIKMPVTTLFLVLLNFTLTSFVLYFSPLSFLLGNFNQRFLTSNIFILLGCFAALGIDSFCRRFKQRYNIARIIIVGILVSYSLLPALWGVKTRLSDANLFGPTTYLSDDIISGFKVLDKLGNRGLVLTSPSLFMGTIVPIYTNKKVYIGRHALTENYEEKNKLADHFYRGEMLYHEAKQFIDSNRIEYVLLTRLEGYVKVPFTDYSFNKGIYKNYLFLTEIYRNKDIVIFKTGRAPTVKSGRFARLIPF